MSRTYKGILFLLSLHLCIIASAQKTTIWIVRHAEKDTAFINRQDPDLTATGQQRALDLAAYLQNEPVVNVYSTDTKRTRHTAKHVKAPIEVYNPKNLTGLLDLISQNTKGKSVLIVGHSNTVLETIEALGGKRPVPLLTDDDYDYIFKVEIEAGKLAVVSFYHFGQVHRGGTAAMHSY
jgi:2,3-bisphosphoglycerate-dependent phosphoglycerate mutase